MKVNGFIIKQMREHASLARDNFTAICSTADLELIEEKTGAYWKLFWIFARHWKFLIKRLFQNQRF